ncbi:DUF3093 domain-containing protein [Catenuloplanes atrovinosus]|uniref:DUF3093 domain-containing protein n=1 Tax=Catenuloplanes atrovinosus TaxID=137266 RepID=A0AAE4C765_9ACTN|nr:DUF3093 domain-containing protein [Catenuloplanes atrovinosus]MDR7273508.1 hypothetical protein [Catenuloplanes atrovinosus]
MAPPGTRSSQPALYRERLTVTWWLWIVALAAAAALAMEVWLGAPGLRAWLPFAVLLPLTALGLWALGRIRVGVGPGPEGETSLLVDDAHLPVRFVSDVVPLDAEGRREILGVAADPLAFVVQRPWISGAVQVLLDDPADPTPYWVVSTRHPVALAQAVLDAKEQGGS